MEDRIIRWASELQSMAQAGLYYSENPFDRERYQRIREIAAEMLAERTGLPLEKVTDLFCGGVGYLTSGIWRKHLQWIFPGAEGGGGGGRGGPVPHRGPGPG